MGGLVWSVGRLGGWLNSFLHIVPQATRHMTDRCGWLIALGPNCGTCREVIQDFGPLPHNSSLEQS